MLPTGRLRACESLEEDLAAACQVTGVLGHDGACFTVRACTFGKVGWRLVRQTHPRGEGYRSAAVHLGDIAARRASAASLASTLHNGARANRTRFEGAHADLA
jgi:hypothetical protein